MASKRYTIIVADRSSGVVRRATLSLRPIFIGAGVLAALPVLIGIGAAWKAKSDVADLRVSHQALEAENASFRSATSDLSTQIASVDCLVLGGGVLAMRPLIVHASSKSQSEIPRRVLHIEYARARLIANDLELAIA